MRGDLTMASRFVLPLPGFVLHPLTSVVVCVVHIYLAIGHLGPLAAGDVQWTHIWKGFGALAGAYVFAALASRRMSVGRCLSPVPDEQATGSVKGENRPVPVFSRDSCDFRRADCDVRTVNRRQLDDVDVGHA